MQTVKMAIVAATAGVLMSATGALAQVSAPKAADFEKMYDRLNPSLTRHAKVTRVDCTPAATNEWRCELAFEKLLDGPREQPQLGGFYETTVRGIYGIKPDGDFGVLRDYQLINQRRVTPSR